MNEVIAIIEAVGILLAEGHPAGYFLTGLALFVAGAMNLLTFNICREAYRMHRSKI